MNARSFSFSALVLVFVGALAHADVVTDWNEAALESIRASNTSPPAASRNLAILHAAVYDAVNGVRPTHDPYLVQPAAPRGASAEAAAVAAAHDVLVTLYPTRAATFDTLRDEHFAVLPTGPARTTGASWGVQVATAIIAARADDGSTATVPWPGSEEPGIWRPTLSFGGVIRPALLPL